MRKLMTGILLAAALPASASITSELNAGASAADVIAQAITACGGSASCQELAIAEAVTAGVDITTAVNLAVKSGVSVESAIASASEAGLKSGQSVESVLAAAGKVEGATQTEVVAGVTAGAKNSGTDVEQVKTIANQQGFSAESILVGSTGATLGETATGNSTNKGPVVTPNKTNTPTPPAQTTTTGISPAE